MSLDGDDIAATEAVGSDGSEWWSSFDVADVQLNESEADDTVDVFLSG